LKSRAVPSDNIRLLGVSDEHRLLVFIPAAVMERNPQDSSPNESDSEEVVEYTIKLKPAPEKPKYYNPPLLWKKIKYKSEFQPEGL
jgi:hypothetical protein